MRTKLQIRTMLAIALFLYAAFRLAVLGWEYEENRKMLDEASNLFKAAQLKDTDEVHSVAPIEYNEEQEARDMFKPLLEINPDIVGWIRLEGSPIDYPVVQGSDNERYLNRNYKGEESKAGSIFMDFRNNIESEQRHTLLYGHRMKDGSMFGDLKKYLNQNYYDTHRQFQLDTLYVTFNAEIFSVYYTTTDFNYLDTEFSDDESFGVFLEKLQSKSLYAKDMELTSGDRIVTLSTCDYILDPVAGRLVVHARLKRL